MAVFEATAVVVIVHTGVVLVVETAVVAAAAVEAGVVLVAAAAAAIIVAVGTTNCAITSLLVIEPNDAIKMKDVPDKRKFSSLKPKYVFCFFFA